jgi:hypothetical protein
MIFGPSVRADAADRPVHGETDRRTATATAAENATITYEGDGTPTRDLPAIRTNGSITGNERAKAQVAPFVAGASPDAVYSNLATFQNQSFAAGGATQQILNTITRLAADDLNLIGTPPYSVNGFRFIVTNLNAVDVSARPLVRFYLPNGPGGGPGTLIESRTYNPTVFTAGRVGTIKTSSTFVLRTSEIWAGIAFDNNGGATGATAAQLDNLAQAIFSPANLGTSTDQYFVTTAAGSFDSTIRSARSISAGRRRRTSAKLTAQTSTCRSPTRRRRPPSRRQRGVHHHREQRRARHGVRCVVDVFPAALLQLDLRGSGQHLRRDGTLASTMRWSAWRSAAAWPTPRPVPCFLAATGAHERPSCSGTAVEATPTTARPGDTLAAIGPPTIAGLAAVR